MKEPLFPEDEHARMCALRSLNILDTQAEERFDRYTRLAQRMFGVPIALVSLVDTDRQWFKSRQGLDAAETPRDISFCGHTIHHEEPLVIEDTHQDERFHDNPLVTADPNIRFYAGMPVTGPSGYRMGTLCLIDEKPRTLQPEDLQVLKDLAAMVTDELSSLQLVMTDELTGLSNRRGFFTLAQQALAMCERNHQPVTYVGIDLNDFKGINDSHGHAAGDEALQAFANIMLSTFRDSDVIARLGGDEFGVLLTGTDTVQAQIGANRLKQAVQVHNQASQSAYSLAFSAGLAACTKSTAGLSLAQQEADRNMYMAKQNCRQTNQA